MNVITVANALKFFDLQPERRVRIWFVVLMGVFAAGLLLPFVDPDFTDFLQELMQLTQGAGRLPHLNGGQWNFLAFQVVVRVVAIIAGIDYLHLFLKSGDALKRLPGKVWFRLIVFQLMSTVIYVVSAPFLLIPYIVFITMFIFVQPELMKYGGSIAKAMQQSYLLGKGVRLHVASSVILLAALFLLAESWLSPLSGGNLYGIALIGGFLFAWEVLSQAKLTGMLYKSLVQRASINKPLTPR